ncbi:TPA: hypothetical protein ACGATL_000259 [Raoultella ornithinolytica]
MAELRAGGLALIIRSPFDENVGKTVSLIKFMGGGEWELTALSDLKGALYPVRAGDSCVGLGQNLMPIDGDDFSNEDERQKELEHA